MGPNELIGSLLLALGMYLLSNWRWNISVNGVAQEDNSGIGDRGNGTKYKLNCSAVERCVSVV